MLAGMSSLRSSILVVLGLFTAACGGKVEGIDDVDPAHDGADAGDGARGTDAVGDRNVPADVCPSLTGNQFPSSMLPDGACVGTAQCNLTVSRACGGDPKYTLGPADGYTCTCTAGAWVCKLVNPAASLCPIVPTKDGG